MRLLLDTCMVIFIAQDPDRLSQTARELLVDKDTPCSLRSSPLVSTPALPNGSGSSFRDTGKTWFRDCVERNGWNLLPLTMDIMEEPYSLPEPIHRDPVDRILIAASRREDMTIITTDRLILAYLHVKSRA